MGNDVIVAIELGSSKISGIAGTKTPDGSIEILAYCKEDSSTFMKKGMVYNIDKTAECLSKIMNTLQLQLHCTISKAYVGIGGNALRTIENRVPYKLNGETKVTQEIIDNINDEDTSLQIPNMEILDVIPQEYKVGRDYETDPVGIVTDSIEGDFLNVICKTTIKKNLETCLMKAHIEVLEYYISPKATAVAVLNESERKSCCALIDFGAETTTISIYNNSILKFLSTLPLGGNNITKDIMSEKIEKEDAERLKIKYGYAKSKVSEDSEDENYSFGEPRRTISAKLLADIIEARQQEIIANVWHQIEISGQKNEIIEMVLTGGASNMRELVEAIKSTTNFAGEIKIMKAPCSSFNVKWNEMPINGTINTILGLLSFSKESCGDIGSIGHEKGHIFHEDDIDKNVEIDKTEEDENEDDYDKDQEKQLKEEQKQLDREHEKEIEEARKRDNKLLKEKRRKERAIEKEGKNKKTFGNILSNWKEKLFSDPGEENE